LARLLINSHHFSQPGLHKSRAQIIRDINSIYFINQKTLKELVDNDTGSCHVCQLFDTASQSERIGSLPRYDKPRLSWSLDLITDLPKSDKNFKIILVAVDDFSNYLIAVPLKDTSSIELIRAIRNHIFTPFGCPKSIRTDEQPSIYNSREFYEFLKRHSVELFATAVASPFSNGRAERHIKTFKHSARKYFYQNNCINQWDEHLTFIVNSLNTSINSFNHSPEEIMFGQTLPSKLKLIDIESNDSQAEPSSAIDKLIERANKARTDYQNRKKMKEASNATFKNKTSIDKNFNLGDLVLHRQLQVSTGTSSKWKPIFNGPFVIETVNKDKTFSCRNLLNNKVIKAHSTNLTHYKIDRSTIKLNSDQLSKPIFK
jgi:transposase InsO family protein